MKKPIFYLLKKPSFHFYQTKYLIEISLWFFNIIIPKQ